MLVDWGRLLDNSDLPISITAHVTRCTFYSQLRRLSESSVTNFLPYIRTKLAELMSYMTISTHYYDLLLIQTKCFFDTYRC